MTASLASAEHFKPPPTPSEGRMGHSGTIGTTRPRRPHDAGPQGQEKWRLYEKTRRDPKVRRATRLFHDVLQQADWYVAPAGDGKRAGVLADYCAEVLGVGREVAPETIEPRTGQMRDGWLTAVACLGEAPWDGFRTMEMLFKLAPSRYVKTARPLVFIDELADMEPASVAEWFSEDGRRPFALRQRATWDMRRAGSDIVPMWKLLYATYGATGTAFEGRGLLDALVDVAMEKATVRGSTSIGFDRAGQPMPELDFDYKAYAETEQVLGGEGRIDSPDAFIASGKKMAENARLGESAYLMKTNFMKVGRAWGDVAIDPAERWMRVLNGEIDAVGLAGFLDLTDKGTGRVGDIRRSAQRRAVLSFIRRLAIAVREQIFKLLIGWSFGPAAVADAPFLEVDGIGVERLLEAIEFLGPLGNQDLVEKNRIQGPMTNALIGPRRTKAEAPATPASGAEEST